jgi:hypothetical protein
MSYQVSAPHIHQGVHIVRIMISAKMAIERCHEVHTQQNHVRVQMKMQHCRRQLVRTGVF